MESRNDGDDVERPPERVSHHITQNPLSVNHFGACTRETRRIAIDSDHFRNDIDQVGSQRTVASPHIEGATCVNRNSIEHYPVAMGVVIPPIPLIARHSPTLTQHRWARDQPGLSSRVPSRPLPS